jgi:hypothetical protein
VNAHTHVLKDLLSLIRQLEFLSFLPEQDILLTSADVATLYPSINIEDGMKALHWLWQNTPAYHRIYSRSTSSSLDLFSKPTMSNARALRARFCRRLALWWAHLFFGYVRYHFHDLAETAIIKKIQQQTVHQCYYSDLVRLVSGMQMILSN